MSESGKQNLKDILGKCYEEYSDAIFRYCYFHTGNREKSLDITQDTFIKTWDYVSSSKNVENLRPFLYKVAKNLIIDERRKKKSGSLDELTEAGFEPENEISEMEIKEDRYERKILLDTVGELDPIYKDVILLRYVEDMSIKEIANVLRENENNISVRIHRGIEKLKNILNSEK